MPKRSNNVDDPQEEAVSKNSLPDGVETQPPVQADEVNKENEQAKGKLDEFGFTSVGEFQNKVQSDSQFATAVARKFLGLDADKSLVNLTTTGAPQERNVTGTLDHSEYPPKIKEVS